MAFRSRGSVTRADQVDQRGQPGRGAGESSSATRTYAAFLSYSRAADGRLAPALQMGLHRFARPWNRMRALHVFRDDASLEANPGLWSSIEAALDASQFFVLLASPEAASSPWVEKEVRHWLATKSARSLLIALTNGEIVWDERGGEDGTGDFDWQRTTALPRCLGGRFEEEPRWVDLRWARTVEHLSLANPEFRGRVADLAAALHGRPKDELIGEDVQQHKRTMRLARSAGVILVVLAMVASVSAVVALIQRNDAREQAAIAEAREFAARAESSENPNAALALAVEAEARTPTALPEARAAFAHAIQRASSTIARPDRVFNADDRVEATVWSPDGERLASASYDKIQIWDVRSGKPAGDALAAHASYVEAVAWSPDGSRLASAGDDGTVRLWDVGSGRQIGNPLLGHTGWVQSVAWSPDGSRLASASWDHTVRLWDTHTGAQIGGTLRGHTDAVMAVAWSYDGERLASAGDDKTVRLWDAPTGKPIGRPLLGHTDRVWDVAWSPDGTRLASAGGKDGVRVLDAATGKPLGPNLRRTGDFQVHSLAWSPDGKRLATAVWGGLDPGFTTEHSIDVIRVWKVAARGLIDNSLRGHTEAVTSLGWSRDGTRLVSGSDDRTVRLWEARTGRPLPALLQRLEVTISYIAWSPDGARLASVSEDGIPCVEGRSRHPRRQAVVALWRGDRRGLVTGRHPAGQRQRQRDGTGLGRGDGEAVRCAHANRRPCGGVNSMVAQRHTGRCGRQWRNPAASGCRHREAAGRPGNGSCRLDGVGGLVPGRHRARQREQGWHDQTVGRLRSKAARPAATWPRRRRAVRGLVSGWYPAGQRREQRSSAAMGSGRERTDRGRSGSPPIRRDRTRLVAGRHPSCDRWS
jgi:WD40 repeat protein